MVNLKTIITGATGWLGSELTRILLSDQKTVVPDLHLFSAFGKKLEVNKKQIIIKTVDSFNDKISIENYFDFAFVTREKIDLIGPEKYKEANIKAINDSVSLIYKSRPRNVILASSGAVYKKGKNWKEANNFLYSDLKILQEEKIKEVCAKTNANLLIIRIFNLSGRGVIKVNDFAISQIINNALNNHEILIKSNYLVNRTYCDVTQLLNLLLIAAKNCYNGTFDSFGIKIELRDLVEKSIKELSSKSKFYAPEADIGSVSDDYFSESKIYNDLLMKFLGEESFSIKQQIHKTASWLISNKSI